MNIRAHFCMHSRMRSVLRYAVINTIFIMRKLYTIYESAFSNKAIE